MLQTDERIDAVVILGSGLGGVFGDGELVRLDDDVGSGVIGHRGRLALWRPGGRTMLVALGRRHVYEGVAPEELTRPIGIGAERGAREVIVTNAAGGLDRRFGVGEIMLIAGVNALMLGRYLPLLQGGRSAGRAADAGDANPTQERHPNNRDTPDDSASHFRRVHAAALERGVALREGTYAAVHGPSYETRAEIRMLRRMGAGAVGMSTVPEYLAAARHRMRVTGLSLITNILSDTGRVVLTHDEVVEAGLRAHGRMRLAIEAALDAAGIVGPVASR